MPLTVVNDRVATVDFIQKNVPSKLRRHIADFPTSAFLFHLMSAVIYQVRNGKQVSDILRKVCVDMDPDVHGTYETGKVLPIAFTGKPRRHGSDDLERFEDSIHHVNASFFFPTALKRVGLVNAIKTVMRWVVGWRPSYSSLLREIRLREHE